MIPFDYSYYRTQNQAEIDLVLEIKKKVIPIEIKTGTNYQKKTLIGLKEFMKNFYSPFGIVINNSDRIALIEDNVIQIPATFLF